MKKISLAMLLCLVSLTAKAALVDSADKTADTSARAWAGYGGNAGKWYKCTTKLDTTSNLGACVGFKMYYTSISGGTGTQADPYILSGCSLTATGAGCACNSHTYLSNGNKCMTCPGNFAGAMPAAVGLHRNTSCVYCAENNYKTASSCEMCPEDGKSMGGTVPIEACYIPGGTQSGDESGSFEYTKDCHYSES